MRRSSFSTTLYIALVFLSGAVVGGFSHRLYTMKTVLASPVVSPKPDDYRSKYLEEMRTRLSLSPEQVKELSNILDSTKSRFHEVKAKWDKEAKLKAKPELRAIQEDQVQKIKGILSAPQQSEYEKLRIERDKRRSATKTSTAAGN